MRPSPKSLTRRPINAAAAPHGRTAAGSLDHIASVARNATGWLPHTARAALTGLRKRGYDVHLVRGGRETAAVYRMTTLNAGGSR